MSGLDGLPIYGLESLFSFVGKMGSISVLGWAVGSPDKSMNIIKSILVQ